MDFEANREHAHQSDPVDFTPAQASLSAAAAAAAAAKAVPVNAIPLMPDANGVIVLPAGVSLDDLEVIGRDLIITGPNGQVYVVHDGAVYVPQIVVEGVAVPPLNLAALLTGTEPQPAAGNAVSSSGGNFADPVGNIQPAYDLGNLLPYTELAFPQPEVQEILPVRINRTPDVNIQDGGPASKDTVDAVSETGLPARGSNPVESPGSGFGNNAHITTGSIIIDSPDGIGSVTVNGVVYTGAGQQITGTFGSLTLGALTNGVIGYTYTLADNTSGDNTSDVFVVVVTDPDGDSSTARLTVTIADDVPTARNDVDDVPAGSYAPITGNVLTGAGTTTGATGADTLGADGAVVNGIRTGTAGEFAALGSSINGQYGVLTINANGTYTYTRNAGTAGGVSDVFSYRIADGDIDTSTATLTINIADAPVAITFVPTTGAGTQVDEAQLAARDSEPQGSQYDGNPEATSASITFSSPDGVASVSLGGTVINPSGLPQTVSSNSTGTLVVTSYSFNAATGQGTIGYTFTLNDNTLNTAGSSVSFPITVVDLDGDTNPPSNLVIHIIDDAPIAVNDTDSIAAGTYGPATGNVITDAENDGGKDTVGADNATVTQVVSVNVPANTDNTADGSGNYVLAGQYGTLTLNTNGTYSYTRDAGTAGGVTDTFTYTLTDGDGDSTTATLAITIGDARPVIGENALVQLDDDALTGGNPGGTGDDPNAVNTSGTLSGSGGDGALTWAFQTTGNPAGFTYVANGSGIDVMQGATKVLAITLNTGTGAYTVTQVAPIVHAAGSDENNAPFTLNYTVSDADTDTASGTLSISVDDDTPVAVNDTDSLLGGAVGPATGNVITDAENDGGKDSVGADAPGTVTAVASVNVPANTDNTADGSGNYVLAGQYGTLTLNMNGTYSYVRSGSGAVNANEVFTYTLTDHDGDSTTATLTITLQDGVPTVGQNALVQLDDDALTGGNPGGTGDDPNAVNTSGTLSGSGGDGALTWAFQTTGNPAGFTYVANGSGIDVMQGATKVLAITLNTGTGAYTVTQVAPIVHAAGSDENNAPFTLNYTVSDADTDTASGTLSISVDDDTPVAVNDTDTIAAGTYGPATGNVITDAENDGGKDSVGADAPGTVTAVASVNVPANTDNTADGSGNYVLAGQYGTLTLNTDGTYSYSRNAGTAGGVNDAFTYTLTDHDGDSTTATLTITIVDALPVTAANALVQLDDDALTGGNPGGTGDDPNAVNTSGTLAASGGDGPLTWAFQTTGNPAGFTYVANGSGIDVMQGATKVLAITLNTGTGAYTVTQVAPIVHAAGSDENNAPFTLNYTVSDADTDTASGTLSISVDDDTPTVTNVALGTGVSIDETAAVTPAGFPISATSANPVITYTAAYGADGAAASGALVFGLAITNTVAGATPIQTAIGNYAVSLVQVDGDTIEGRYNDGAEKVAFRLDIASDGKVTVTQMVPLEHNTDGGTAPDYDDVLNLTSSGNSLVSATVTIKDFDGDTAGGSVAIGANITVRDDGPKIDVVAGTESGVLLTTHDALTPGAGSETTFTTANFGGVFSINGAGTAAGADGQASQTLTYALNVGDVAPGGSGLTSHNAPITLLKLTGGTVVGYTGGVAPTAETDATVVFSVKVAGDGVVTVVQYQQVDHDLPGATGSYDSQLELLPEGKITLTATATITDNDGDFATDTATVDLGTNIRFADDGPSLTGVAAGAAVSIDETTAGSPSGFGVGGISATSAAAVISATTAFGADGAAASGSLVYGLVVSGGGSTPLQTAIGNFAISLVQVDGDTIEGRYNGSNVAFRLDIAGDGKVTITQFVPLEHNTDGSSAAALNDALNLMNGASSLVSATVTLKDFDGDTATASVPIGANITILDDGPKFTTVTDPLQIDNDATPSGSGTFLVSLGADGARETNNAIDVSNFAITVNGIAATGVILTAGIENASDANYTFQFDYDIGIGGTTTAFGSLVFHKDGGTYDVALTNGPIQGFTIDQTSDADTVFTEVNPQVTVAGLDTNLFVQFTGMAEPGSGTGTDNLRTIDYDPNPAPPNPSPEAAPGTWEVGELFNQAVSTVQVSSTAAGVGGNTIQGGEILDFNLYASNPNGTLGNLPTASASSMFLKFDTIGSSEDMIVVLKLWNDTDHDGVIETTDEFTTRALLVQNTDITKGTHDNNPGTPAPALPAPYQNIVMDNNDGIIFIESNDFNAAGENWKIVGAQILGSDEGVAGTAINFVNTTGAGGASNVADTGTYQNLSLDTDNNPFKITSIGFVRTDTTDQHATISFDVTLTDADGDTATVSDVTVNIGVPPVVVDLDGDGAEFLGLDAGVAYDYGHGLVATAWAGADDGILAVDLDGDGKVSSAAEFVFGGAGLTDLEGVAVRYDSNHDGVLDARDAAFAQFGVWQDANSNGVADAGEFHTLTDLGITAIRLTSDGAAYSAAGGDVAVAGTAIVSFADGSTGTAADATFAIARLSQQVENAVTAAAAGSLVTASIAAAVVADSSEAPVAPAPSDSGVATVAEPAANEPAPAAAAAPSAVLAGPTEPGPVAAHETQHAADEPGHQSALADAASGPAPAVEADAGGDAPAHLAAAIVFDAGGAGQAMDALLVAAGQGGQAPAQAAAGAAQPVVSEVLAEGQAAGFVDALLDHVVGHAAASSQPADLSALLAAHVDGGSGGAPAPMPIMEFDHAGAEMLAAAHA